MIVDVNTAYATATFTHRSDIVGRSLFDVFPDNPDHPFADGVSNLYNSLKTVAKTGQPHAMAVQRYDIRDPAGAFVERHWQPINTPFTIRAAGWFSCCITSKTFTRTRSTDGRNVRSEGASH